MKAIGVQMKKIISAVLAFLIIFSIFPWNVLAQEIAEEVNSVEEQVVEV